MDINEAREKLNQIDDQIVPLFVERMKTVLDIAQYKKDRGLAVLDRSRETDILNRVTAASGEEFAGYTRVLFNTLFDLSRSYQSQFMHRDSSLQKLVQSALQNTPAQMPAQAVVACQGVEGAYSQLACEKMFKHPQVMYFGSFESVFSAIENGFCDYGVLPLENSTAGSVKQIYDLMLRHSSFKIVRSTRLKVDHNLVAKKGTKLEDIKEIFSHPQAISQCTAFLEKLGKDVKVTPCENTAAAAAAVAQSDRTDVAAISSHRCIELYGLERLAADIQDRSNNYTRFICISKKLEIYPGADKTSLMVVLPHRPGSLYQILARFYALGLNLIKLESRPLPDREFEFMFYFDLETSVYSDEFIRMVDDLSAICEEFQYLGSYSEVI